MSIPPVFNSGDCGCAEGPFNVSCNPVGRCCFGNQKAGGGGGDDEGGNCPTEPTSSLNLYNWPKSSFPHPHWSIDSTYWIGCFPFQIPKTALEDYILWVDPSADVPNPNCPESEHNRFNGDPDGTYKYNTFQTSYNQFCDTYGGFLNGDRLGRYEYNAISCPEDGNGDPIDNSDNFAFNPGFFFRHVGQPNFEGIILSDPNMYIAYKDISSLQEDTSVLLSLKSNGTKALVLKIRLIDQQNLKDQYGQNIQFVGPDGSTSAPRIKVDGALVELDDTDNYVGKVLTYRFPLEKGSISGEGEEVGSELGLLEDMWVSQQVSNGSLRGPINKHLSGCSDPFPKFGWKYTPYSDCEGTDPILNWSEVNENENIWGVRFEYWWYFEGTLTPGGSTASCPGFNSQTTYSRDSSQGSGEDPFCITVRQVLTPEQIQNIIDASNPSNPTPICNNPSCNGTPLIDLLDSCACTVFCEDCKSSFIGCGGGDEEDYPSNQFCACCKGVGGQYEGITCGDCAVCGQWYPCGSCPPNPEGVSCPNNCEDCPTDFNSEVLLTTYEECMKKKTEEGYRSICFRPIFRDEFGNDSDLLPCPECPNAAIVDQCGCHSANQDCQALVETCSNGDCISVIPDDCTKGSVKTFQFAVANVGGFETDGTIKLKMTAPYKDQIVYDYCGRRNSDMANNIEGRIAFDIMPQYYADENLIELGSPRLYFDQTVTPDAATGSVGRRCLPKSQFNTNNILRRGTGDLFNEVISAKMLQFCRTNGGGFCANCDNEDVEYQPPVLMKGMFTKYELNNSSALFKRDKQVNRLIAFSVVDNEITSSSSINSNSSFFDTDGTEYNSSVLDTDFNQTEIAQSMVDDTELNKIKADFTSLDTIWHMATYCKTSLQANSVFRDNDAYRFLSYSTESSDGWWHGGGDETLPDRKTTYLRIWSTQVRSVYKSCFDFSTDDCQENYEDATAGCYFRLDHEYVKDSQSERGITKSNFTTPVVGSDGVSRNYNSDSVVYKRTGANCEDTNTCIFCNPWISKWNVGEKGCYSYVDASGNFVAETEGAMLIPMRPHEYQIEFWYASKSGTLCTTLDESGQEVILPDYPSNFHLVGVVQSCPDCLELYDNTLRESVQDLVNNENEQEGVMNPYFDTCGSFFWQGEKRNTTLRSYYITNNPSTWSDINLPETNIPLPNVDFSDDFTVTIALYPFTGTAQSSYVDPNEEANSIPTMQAVTPTTWNEDQWYHVDPKHNFDFVARGMPQAMGRWTELPFKNYANEYLDPNETQLGFYLTISAAHMSGINFVNMYLDGASVDSVGHVTLTEEYKHPKEECVAKVDRDDNGNLINALEEYTARIETNNLTTGVHEVRAKISPNQGVSRLLYGEPPTGNAEVLVKGETLGGRVEGEYKNWGPISGKNFPLSKAQWSSEVPDGPPLLNDSIKTRINKHPAIGSTYKWNLSSSGFKYVNASSNTLYHSPNKYVFGATSQQNILFNGYESFWFNYNPAPTQVVVGDAADVSAGDADVTTIAAAFALLDTGSVESARHDAEIILLPGTTATPRKYHWPNSIDSETLTFTAAASWCQNALQKKSLVIKSKNPDSKSKTILWFPPGPDRVEMAWDDFALHVKDLTVYTSLTGSSVTQCLKSTGSNCRLLVENVDFESVCVTAIKASTLVDGSGDIICGDSLTRDSSGTVSGQIQYNKCRKIRDGEDNYQCSSDTTICGVNCCGILANGSGCADCTGSSCQYCRANCKCRMSEVQWWPFFSSDTVDLSTTGTNLTAEIDCGADYPCTASALSACKGIFGSDLVHTSPSYCLGTEKGECVILGLYNHDLMELADNDSWTMGIYAKSINSKAVPGPVVKNPVMVKHFTVDNMTDTLICDEGHSLIMDLWVKNIDNYSDPDKQDTDIVKWSLDDFETKYGVKVADDYSTSIGSPNPRAVYNFNSFIENRMMINIKVDNCHSRIINMPGPSLTVRDLMSSYNGHVNNVAGNPNNFGCFNYRNFLFKNFHLDEKADSHQVFGHVPINHLYFENFVVSSNVGKYCLSTDSSTTACKNVSSGPFFPLSQGKVSSLETKYLHYGRKQIQNLYMKDCVFHNLGTSELLLNTKYPSSIDYGNTDLGFAGSNFAVDGFRYYWVGALSPFIRNVRQVKNDFTNTSLICNAAGVGSTFGPVVHKKSSPAIGRTSSGSDINSNPYGPFDQWLVDNPTEKQKLSFGVSTASRITSALPRICKTHIQGSSFKTLDSKDACYDTTKGTCSGETDPFQFPSAAHSNFITEIEALSSGNLLDHGIPNIGGMKLSFAATKNYYHDICDYTTTETCVRSGSRDARKKQEESLTVISYDSGTDTYSWVSNTKAECDGNCLSIRDHYFVDSNTDPVDLTWIPVIDECTCCDLDPNCTPTTS